MALPRLHAFEFLDQSWFPAPLRRAAVGYLAFIIGKSGAFVPLAPRLAALVDAAGGDRIVDLCAGGAGPYPTLLAAVDGARGRRTELILTDLHPTPAADGAGDAVRWEPQPVDARAVPRTLAGARTLFDGLHHFRPADARAVFADAVAARAPVLAAEASERSVAALIAAILIPLFVLLVMPFVRPRAWPALALTYLLPIVPLVIFWDGFVSCWRTYRPDELRALVAGLDEYDWEIGQIRRHGRSLTFIAGRPRP